MNIDAALVNGLAEKLESLELSDDERSLIDSILARAALVQPDEVAGFTMAFGLPDLRGNAEPIAAALGLFPSSAGAIGIEYGRRFGE